MHIIILSRSGKDSTENMQLVTVNSWIYFFFDCFFRGFTLYTLLCMMLRLLPNPVWRKEADKINAAKNLLMPVAAVVAVISILIIMAESDQAMPEDQFAFVQVKWEFEMVELVTAFLSWVIMLSFCWPRPRKSWWLSMISLLLLNTGWIIRQLGRLKNDNLSREWDKDKDPWQLYALELLVFGILLGIVYYLLYIRNKKRDASAMPN